MTVKITAPDYVEYIKNVALKIKNSRDYVTELDAATGDGDHWANLNAGFEKLILIEEELRQLSLSELFKKIAMTLMSGVGGSSGILYASAYLKASAVVADKKEIDIALLYKVLETELDAIMQRGGAKPGYKTMIDSLYQAVQYFKKALNDGKADTEVLMAMKEGAQKGMNDTRDMEAIKGRAYYQADKGVGHLDPGAVTMCYQLEILADAFLI